MNAVSPFFLMAAGVCVAGRADAFFEDICISKKTAKLDACVEPSADCVLKPSANNACAAQLRAAVKVGRGRSTIHADATYFLAQALGYRPDVAYWIAAYNEVTDLGRYAPIDQCGVQATPQSSGAGYITAAFDGFVRTNTKTDGPLWHYVVPFSPNGDGTDVHGAGGVQAVYPFHYPAPGYPSVIDDVYEGALSHLRRWAMQPGSAPGVLCAAGLTVPRGDSHFSGERCLTGVVVRGEVPLLKGFGFGPKIDVASGPKILDDSHGVVLFDQLEGWLTDRSRTTGTLWKDPSAPAVPVQVARIGIYLHALQDTASHATYCGDEAPSPPGGGDPGTYMAMTPQGVQLNFGHSCATGPHVAGHVQETATGDAPLPLRDYTALGATLDELIAFGNTVARPNGWISNPDLLPPNDRTAVGKNGRGQTAADLKALLVGTIVKGKPWTRGESYRSGVVTRPLQQVKALDRLRAMNAALASYGDTLRAEATNPARFVPLELMPGNARDPNDRTVCFK